MNRERSEQLSGPACSDQSISAPEGRLAEVKIEAKELRPSAIAVSKRTRKTRKQARNGKAP
jgi:hypothetical protein